MSSQPIEKHIIESLPGIVYWVNKDSVFLGCNANLASALGLTSSSEIQGMSAEKFAKLSGWTHIQLEAFKTENEEVVKSVAHKLCEESFCINGKKSYYLTQRVPIYNEDKKAIGVISTAVDIGQKMKIEKKNSESTSADLIFLSNLSKKIIGESNSEDFQTTKEYVNAILHYLDSIIACMPGNVYWTDKDSIYLGCNENTARYFGLKSRSEIIGISYKDMARFGGWTEGQEKSFQRDDQEVMRSKKPKLNVEEPPITDSKGNTTYFLTSRVPIFDTKNKVTGIVGISFDITDRKKMEQELEKSKEKAEIASKAKSEFIANMSHDIRVPMTGILGLIQELINLADDTNVTLPQISSIKGNETIEKYRFLLNQLIEKVQEDGQLLIGATDELLQLLNEILETMRLDSGKAPEEVESFNLEELLKHNIELNLPMAQHKKLKLTCEIDEGIPIYFSGMRHYLDRTLLNLLSNALKFTKEGFVKLRVEVLGKKPPAYHLGDKLSLKITVQDSGMGIPEDKFDIIFEHFSRLTPSYQGIYKGAGLGLYTVSRYIEAMKATIKVESQVGEGTSFIITLPLIVSDHSDREKIPYRLPNLKKAPAIQSISSPKTAKAKESTSADTTAKILIVEDNSIAARGAISTINRLYSHCVCETAADGVQTLEMVKKNRYDLIFMDIGLADGEDGFSVTKQIRALGDHYTKQVPIVALTGHANTPEMRKEMLAVGMQDMCSKPLNATLLEPLMQRYVFKYEKEASHCTERSIDDAQSPQLISWAKSLEQCSGDEALLRELLSSLSLDLKMFEEKLKKYYTAHDEQELRKELHRVRGGVVYLTLPQLDNALSLFHEAVKAKPQNPEQLEQLYVQLQQAMEAFWEYIKKIGL